MPIPSADNHPMNATTSPTKEHDMSHNTPLGIAMTQAILSVDGTRNDLIESCRRLRDDLDRLVTQHDNDALPTINALGIVQRQGSEIDRLCAVLDAQRKHVDALMFVQREQAGDVETHDDSDDEAEHDYLLSTHTLRGVEVGRLVVCDNPWNAEGQEEANRREPWTRGTRIDTGEQVIAPTSFFIPIPDEEEDDDAGLQGTFTVTIALGNSGMSTTEEIADALHVIEHRVRNEAREGNVSDLNGNTVGRFLLVAEVTRPGDVVEDEAAPDQ